MVYLYDDCDQISDFCHQQLLRKMWRKISWTDGRTEGQTEGWTEGRTDGWKDGQTDRGKTVYPPPPSGSGGIINFRVTCHFIRVLIGLKSWGYLSMNGIIVLKASHAVVIRWFSLNEAPLGLFKFISDYLSYFEKINIFFNIRTKKVWINL